MKRLREPVAPKPADRPENWPSNIADAVPRLRERVLLPLSDFVSAGFTGSYHGGGQALDSWRLRRRLNGGGS